MKPWTGPRAGRNWHQESVSPVLSDATGSAGRVVSAPIVLDVAEGVLSVSMQISYDTSFIDVEQADIGVGGLNAGWNVAATVDDAAGTIDFTIS